MLRIAALGSLAVLLLAAMPAAAETLPELPEPDWETTCSGAGMMPAARDSMHDGIEKTSGSMGDAAVLVRDEESLKLDLFSEAAALLGRAWEGLAASIPAPLSSLYAGLNGAFQAIFGSANNPMSPMEVGAVIAGWATASTELGIAEASSGADAAFGFAHAFCTA